MTVRSKVSLRIIGELDIESLTKKLGLMPSHSHKKGETDLIGTVLDSDIWIMDTPMDESLPLGKHMEWLVGQLDDRYRVLEEIKTHANIDIFCSVTADELNGFSLSPKALSIFNDLQIRMEVSLIPKAEE